VEAGAVELLPNRVYLVYSQSQADTAYRPRQRIVDTGLQSVWQKDRVGR
jgi:hypothetical protein